MTRQVAISTYQQDLFIAAHPVNKVRCHLGKEKSFKRRIKPSRKLLSSVCSSIKENKKKYKKKRKKLKNKDKN